MDGTLGGTELNAFFAAFDAVDDRDGKRITKRRIDWEEFRTQGLIILAQEQVPQ